MLVRCKELEYKYINISLLGKIEGNQTPMLVLNPDYFSIPLTKLNTKMSGEFMNELGVLEA